MPRRPAADMPPQLNDAAWLRAAYARHGDMKPIAQALGVAQSTVARHLHRHGIAISNSKRVVRRDVERARAVAEIRATDRALRIQPCRAQLGLRVMTVARAEASLTRGALRTALLELIALAEAWADQLDANT